MIRNHIYILHLRDIGIRAFIKLSTHLRLMRAIARESRLCRRHCRRHCRVFTYKYKDIYVYTRNKGCVHVRACIAPSAPRHKLPGTLFPCKSMTPKDAPTAPKHTVRIRKRNRDYRKSRLDLGGEEFLLTIR